MTKKLEFSKWVVAFVILAYLYVVVFSSLLMWKVDDASGLTALIASSGGNLATVISFYMWKAKNENVLKMTKGQIEKINMALAKEEDKC